MLLTTALVVLMYWITKRTYGDDTMTDKEYLEKIENLKTQLAALSPTAQKRAAEIFKCQMKSLKK